MTWSYAELVLLSVLLVIVSAMCCKIWDTAVKCGLMFRMWNVWLWLVAIAFALAACLFARFAVELAS